VCVRRTCLSQLKPALSPLTATKLHMLSDRLRADARYFNFMHARATDR
jgi:hypothetical protein